MTPPPPSRGFQPHAASDVEPFPPDDDTMPPDRGRPLGLRLLALVGALSFLMLGLSVIVPLLRPAPPPTGPQPAKGKPTA